MALEKPFKRVMNQVMESCIQDCLDCYRVCLETKGYCLEAGGEHTQPSHMKAMSDCIETCKMSAHFMIKQSELHGSVCGVCADACAKCAASCESFTDDEMMKNCAEMCRQCEKSCRQMAA